MLSRCSFSCLAALLVGCFDPSDVDGTESDTGTGTDAPTSTAAPDDDGGPAGTMSTGGPVTGDSTGGPTDPDDTGTDDASGDVDPPTLVSVSPEDGASGVLAEAELVFVFSERMDVTTTEAAYQSPDLPASQVSFAWNGDGTVLTVVPNRGLAIASGSDDSVVAETYAFSMMASATDIAGNELENPVDVTFSTARRITMQLDPVADMSGITNPGGTYSEANGWYAVGDWGNMFPPGALRAPLTFDISELPDPVVEWVGATLNLRQTGQLGNAYAAHGHLHVYDAWFVEFGVDAGEDPGDDLGMLADAFVDNEWTSLVVTDAVAEDHPGTRTQFLLMFDGENPGSNTAADSVEGDHENIRLDVEVLVP
jgi:hypothetical protein